MTHQEHQVGSAWPRADAHGINMSDLDRGLSVAAGTALAIAGLRSGGSWPGLLMAAAAGALLYRGVTGKCGVYATMSQRDLARREPGRSPRKSGTDHPTTTAREDLAEDMDEVDQASLDSFPASDPPAWSGRAEAGAN